jgi:hypothetical protein
MSVGLVVARPLNCEYEAEDRDLREVRLRPSFAKRGLVISVAQAVMEVLEVRCEPSAFLCVAGSTFVSTSLLTSLNNPNIAACLIVGIQCPLQFFNALPSRQREDQAFPLTGP